MSGCGRLGGVAVIALVVLLIVTLSGGGRRRCRPRQESSRAARGHPGLHEVELGPAAGRDARSRDVAIPSGPKLATLINAATGQTVDGVSCQAGEQTVVHVHTHLTIFVNGKQQVIPYGIGIPGFQAVDIGGSPSSRPAAASTGCTCTPRTASSTSNRRARRRRFTARPVLRRMGPAAELEPGRPGHGQGDRLLHLARQAGGALHR